MINYSHIGIVLIQKYYLLQISLYGTAVWKSQNQLKFERKTCIQYIICLATQIHIN